MAAMRILQINTFHYPRGGASIYCLKLSEMLREAGHTVLHFAMDHPRSLDCPETAEYWPRYIEYPELQRKINPANALKVLRRTIYSKEAESGLRRLIRAKGPFDVAHIHNIMHHLTPSVLAPLREEGIPVAWTMHDFSLLCPNTNFFDTGRGELCTGCLGSWPHFVRAPLRRCKRGSLAASFVAALEAAVHRIRGILKNVDILLPPSRFMAEKLADAGLDSRARISVIPIFAELPERPRSGFDNFALFAGRLSAEKGVELLIKAWRLMPAEATLKIAGSGPAEGDLKSTASGMHNVEFLGFVQPEKLTEIRRRAQLLIIPSVCWDNFPLSVLEALGDGVPVLAADTGGIPEMVRPGITGELFERDNAEELAMAASRLLTSPEECERLGLGARKVAEAEYSPENHLREILKVYSELS